VAASPEAPFEDYDLLLTRLDAICLLFYKPFRKASYQNVINLFAKRKYLEYNFLLLGELF
jgi:hypothetical protein